MSELSIEGRVAPTEARAGDRVQELLHRWGAAEVCLVRGLCDDQPPDDVAFTFVEPDLTTRDLTYGELRERSERFAAALADLGVGPGDAWQR